MFGFVRHMRPAVLHLRDLGVRITGTPPVLIGGPLLPLAVEARQHLPRRGLDAGGRGEAGQIRLIVFPRIPSHDASHGGVGFQGGGVDRDRAALQETGGHEALLDPREHRPMRLHIDQPTGPRIVE